MRSGKRRMTPRSNQGQPWKGWIFWSGLQERKRGFWIDSRQSFLNPEAVSNSTQCFALGWDSAPSPWPDSNLSTAAGAAAIWSSWADYTTLVRKYSQVPDTGSSPWCCYWYWRQPLCFFNPPLPSLSPTKMERWHCQTFTIRPSWSWSQVWQCDNPFYQKLAPLEWQKECAGKIIFPIYLCVVGKLEHFLFLIFDSTGIVLPVRKSPSDKRHGAVAVKDGPVQFPKYWTFIIQLL